MSTVPSPTMKRPAQVQEHMSAVQQQQQSTGRKDIQDIFAKPPPNSTRSNNDREVEAVPSLELMLTDEEDSHVSSNGGPGELTVRMVPSSNSGNESLSMKPRHAIRTDVQYCHSESCPTCRPRNLNNVTRFLPAPAVDAKTLHRLPRKWWLEPTYDKGWFDTMWSSVYQALGGAVDCGSIPDSMRCGSSNDAAPFDEMRDEIMYHAMGGDGPENQKDNDL